MVDIYLKQNSLCCFVVYAMFILFYVLCKWKLSNTKFNIVTIYFPLKRRTVWFIFVTIVCLEGFEPVSLVNFLRTFGLCSFHFSLLWNHTEPKEQTISDNIKYKTHCQFLAFLSIVSCRIPVSDTVYGNSSSWKSCWKKEVYKHRDIKSEWTFSVNARIMRIFIFYYLL